MMDTLDELEQRVGGKWAVAASARTPQWPMPDDWTDSIDWAAWTDAPPPPDDVPQFPREQWAAYPATRTAVLMACDRLLDMADELTDEQWETLSFLMLYGGRTRLT